MKPAKIRQDCVLKESETVELKQSTSELKEAVVSIAAILNKHQKGELYFGVKNDGIALGQEVSGSTLREISQTIANNIEPKLYPTIETKITGGKPCIKLSFDGHERPYFAYGRAYIRVADENRQLSAKELTNLILRKSASLWDSKLSEELLLDVDAPTLKDFVLRANEAGRMTFKSASTRAVLTKLHLLNGEKLTNAARLLFSKNTPVEVQAAVFAGNDRTTFLDIQQFKGNIFQVLKQSELYLKERMLWRAVLAERTRKEIPEIPVRAITESLVNSLCHRDYLAPESNKIAVYKDRIDIWNPGEFAEGLTPQDFIRRELQSVLRNPLIANCLYLTADIEKWGSGLRRISQECKAANVPVKFEVLKYGFSVVFSRWDERKVAVQRAGKVPEKVPEKVTENQRRILRRLARNPHTTIVELARAVGISERKIKENIRKLKEKGLLRRVGPDKGGHWELTGA